MKLLASAARLFEIFPLLAKNRKYQIQWEYSYSRAWLIVTLADRQMAISYHDGDFRLTPIEDYRGLGYIHTFCYATTIDEALGFVRTYFTKGYDVLFSAMLKSRLDEADQGKFISLAEMKARLNRSLKRWKTQKRKPLEIPPSLIGVVELSPEAKLEQQKMIEGFRLDDTALRGEVPACKPPARKESGGATPAKAGRGQHPHRKASKRKTA